MEESGGNEGLKEEAVSLLAEELIQLSVKSSVVDPCDKPALICTVWTQKSYNPDSFRAQMKSIWKTKRKFEIQLVGQNLFLLIFESDDDLELILEGQPWLFRKQLIIFDRLKQPMERSKIKLVLSLFWIKVGPCLPEFDKQDLMHAIGATFGGIIRSEIKGDFCRIRIPLDVQKPLRRRIFVSTSDQGKCWISFKYEKLLTFCFGCGRMGHAVSSCVFFKEDEREKIQEDPPFSLALKHQSSYTGQVEENQKVNLKSQHICVLRPAVETQLAEVAKAQKPQEEGMLRNVEDNLQLDILDGNLHTNRKTSWRRVNKTRDMKIIDADRLVRKRKLVDLDSGNHEKEESLEDIGKRQKHTDQSCVRMEDSSLLASRPDAMKIISWNVCGLGNPRAVRRLQFLLKQHNPDMVFLMETKVDSKRMERIRRRSGFVNGLMWEQKDRGVGSILRGGKISESV
ncbi:reverse transcriptase [Gossypium australe]|uniref:Reverse transcriptase n=1 Tax=Gossypium australe TaxID=47621 RepID=A0A5B6WDQ8_9ROSI|nr:reverse transcriptase [Gossypium australe]